MNATKIEITLKTILTIFGIIFGIFVMSHIGDIMVQVFIAFVLMAALNPLVGALQKLRMNRIMAILSTYVLFISAIVVIIAALVPPLYEQTAKLFTQLNLPNAPFLDELSHLRFSTTQIGTLVSQYGGSVSKVLEFVLSTFSVLFTFFTVMVMALYLLIGRAHLYTYFTIFFRTRDKKERSEQLLKNVEQALGSWVRGEILLMLTIGIMTFIGLSILNIPFALPLAIFAGLMEALPNIGPTISAVPAIVVAAVSVSPLMGGVTTLLYILIQQIENNFIVPQIMKKAAGIRPLTTIILILVGFRFGGVLGALLSVPLYIVGREILSEFSMELREMFQLGEHHL